MPGRQRRTEEEESKLWETNRALEQMKETMVSNLVQGVCKRQNTGGVWEVGSTGCLPICITERAPLLPFLFTQTT